MDTLQDEVLKVAEVAKILKVSPRTVQNIVKAGRLTTIPIGARDYRIAYAELQRFISTGSKAVISRRRR